MESSGERLKKKRLEKGLSLEEVQKKTKVHLNILKAIEGDSISNLSPIYLKSFIKIYCNFLGVDYKDYLSEGKDDKDQSAQANAPKGPAPAKEPSKASSILDSNPIKLGAFRPSKAVKIAVASVVALALLSLGFFSLGKFISSRKSLAQPKKQAVKAPAPKRKVKKAAVAQEVKLPASTPKLQEIPLRPRKEAISVIRLGMRTREDCFVHLKVDGKVVFHQFLQKGRFESWDGKDRMELSIGNAGAVELEVNGQLFSKLGRKGESIKNILITREGMTIPR